MIGLTDREYAALAFERFVDEVLRPRVLALRAPLAVEVFQSRERVPLDVARAATYRPVALGFRWGPVWSTAWFRLTGRVPEEMAGMPVALRFSSGTEALLWRDGAPARGFDANRDTAPLLARANGGEALELHVEAVCNHPFGTGAFFWDPPEVHARWREQAPGRLEAAELVVIDERARRLAAKLDLARRIALALPEEEGRVLRLLAGLRALLAAAPPDDPLALDEARLDALLAGEERAPSTVCTAVGHAHLDCAWLWPLAEARRKILRSWSNAVELCERDPGFRFLASQAWQYQVCREESPALFERIRRMVAAGRWEAGGAMWVECDANAPSGESFVRQILHGTRFWEDAFGDDAPQTFLFLPDTFGFPPCLPQVMAEAGLSTFLTDKLAWSERNEYPHVTFRWRGLDGTEVLTHLTPGTNYNAPLQPEDLLRGEARLLRLDGTPIGERRALLTRWLQPFGFGDGGGGPTAEQVERARLLERIEGLPRVERGRVGEFCHALHAERDRARENLGVDLPVWDGELYLEQHRGTYTTHGWLKRANARVEERLREIECWLATAPQGPDDVLRGRMDAAWKTLLLHQFHDVLPGTSIGAVYEDARRAFAALECELDELGRLAAERLWRGGAAVWNPCSHLRDAVVDIDGRPRLLRDLPALGLVSAALSDEPDHPVAASERTLANGMLSVEIDDAGRIGRLAAAGAERAVNAERGDGSLAPLVQLALYEDLPRRWEAWNVDEDYADRVSLLTDPAEAIELVEDGPLRAKIEVRRTFGASRAVLRYVLRAHQPFVEVELDLDWRERRRLLRALFPTAIRARRWTSGVPLGCLERPTHRNTSWEQARFEVPGRRWMDLSRPGLGLAVLDHAVVGRSCQDGVLRLSLARGPLDPDPGAGQGRERIRFGLLPHGGGPLAAGVARRADEFAEPARVLDLRSPPDAPPLPLVPFTLECVGAGDVEVLAWKPAESGDARILRLVERAGGSVRVRIEWPRRVATVRAVDLLERPTERPTERPLFHNGSRTELELGPFRLATIEVRFA